MATATSSLAVLVVDDEKTNQLLMQKLLQNTKGWNIKVECASDGAEALKRVQSSFYDLVFLDYKLPGMNGLEVLAQMRQASEKTSVVMITAAGDAHIAVEAMKNGAMDYLSHDDLLKTDLSQIFRRLIEKRELVNQNMELRQINLMKNEFIANVSHELRTPLSVVIGFAKTMEEGKLGPLTEEQKKALKLIVNRSEGLLLTLNQILRMRDSMEGHLQLLLKPLDLSTFLLDILENDPPRGLNKKDLKIETQMPEGESWVLADKPKLAEAVSNILANAVKFAPANTVIKLTVATNDGKTRISVRDEGPGIAPEILPHIFQRFFAANQGPTRQYSGLGLGLALTQQVVELHNGRIWLESKGSGSGCTAHISLPAASKTSAEKTAKSPIKVAKKKVLVVEDNPDLVEVLLLYLAGISTNVQVSTAETGLMAFDKISEEIPDLIILDMMMPGMSGFEVLERLRRSPETAKIPVLVVTGYGEKLQDITEKGAQDVLLKPFEKNIFNQKVLRLLNEPHT